MLFLLFVTVVLGLKNDAIGVKVFKPAGPKTSSLECNEYGYIKYSVNNAELVKKASSIDFELIDLTGTVAVFSISKQVPFKSNGYIAFFPWQLSLVANKPIYSVALRFFDENENLMQVEGEGGVKFDAIHSAAFSFPDCKAPK